MIMILIIMTIIILIIIIKVFPSTLRLKLTIQGDCLSSEHGTLGLHNQCRYWQGCGNKDGLWGFITSAGIGRAVGIRMDSGVS